MRKSTTATRIVVGAVLLLWGIGWADVIVKNNGEEIRGRVIKADNLEVQIEVGGITLRLPRSDVKDIQYDSDLARVSERIEPIRRMLQQGKLLGPGEALDLLQSASEIRGAAQNKDLVNLARAVGDQVLRSLNSVMRQAGDPGSLLSAVDRLRAPSLLPLWHAAYPGADYDTVFRAQVYEIEGGAYLLRGKTAILGQPRNLKAAQQDFGEAVKSLGKQDFLNNRFVNLELYRWGVYWQIRALKEDLETQVLTPEQSNELAEKMRPDFVRLFREARITEPGPGLPPLDLNLDLIQSLDYLEDWSRQNGFIWATPTPGLTPPPTPAVTWTLVPTEVPVITPTPVSAGGALSDTLQTLKNKGLLQAWNRMKQYLGGATVYIRIVIYVLVAAFVWIVIPRVILRLRERRGDIHAARFRCWTRLSGWVALVGYIVVAIKTRPKRGKHKCPFCNYALDDIESYSDMNFVACPNCHQTITPVYDLEDYIEYLVEVVKRELEMSKMGAMNLKAVIEKDAMTKLVRAVLTLAVRRRASDLHVEPEAEGVKLRARIDGMLQELTTMPKVMASPLVSALKVMGNLDIAERRVPQDGRFQTWVDKADIDIRIASAPSSLGEKCSLRLLDSRTISVDPSRLGMGDDARNIFEKTIRAPHGLVLVTGPTGSGKSTTLYVAMQQINTGEKNIISIEDPVEFKIKGVNQMQVNVAANFTFATGLRSILRQDPDVIMIGEIRDRETADIAIEAAMTGHLVLSTLHTIDSATAIGRLVDLDVEPRRFADALQLIIAQRLLRLNCTECGKPYKPKKSELDSVGLEESAMADDTWKSMKGTGCDVCRFTGYFGRMGLFEFLFPDDEIRDLIETKANTGKVRQTSRNKGMKTLREEGLARFKEGLTTLEEIIRVTA